MPTTDRPVVCPKDGRTAFFKCPDCGEEWYDRAQSLSSSRESRLAARVNELEVLMVKCALPYEALLMDGGSRRWIAPSAWKLIEDAVTEIRAALPSA